MVNIENVYGNGYACVDFQDNSKHHETYLSKFDYLAHRVPHIPLNCNLPHQVCQYCH